MENAITSNSNEHHVYYEHVPGMKVHRYVDILVFALYFKVRDHVNDYVDAMLVTNYGGELRFPNVRDYSDKNSEHSIANFNDVISDVHLDSSTSYANF